MGEKSKDNMVEVNEGQVVGEGGSIVEGQGYKKW